MDTISIYDIYGVKRGQNHVEDFPLLANPRKEQGDLQALAQGIGRSGRRDHPIVVWLFENPATGQTENILLDGKRTVTAMLQFPALREVIGTSLPVMRWEPASQNGLTPIQEAMAFMARANSSRSDSGHKLLTFAEEAAAARRLRASGLRNEQVGKIMGYCRETVRQLLEADDKLHPDLKAAIASPGESPSEERPLSKRQAVELSKRPPDEQVESLRRAQEAARKQLARSGKTTAQGIAKECKRKAERPDSLDPADEKDRPRTPIETLECILSNLSAAADSGEMPAPAAACIRKAQRWALILKRQLHQQETKTTKKG